MATQMGSLKSMSINGMKMYTLSTQQPSIATWLDPKKQRALRKDPKYQQRVELIQDLRFETATGKIKATPDGEYLIASGIYPPQIKVYELRELSLKFERHFDAEIIDFQVLDDDYSKLAFLCTDRSVSFHAKYGKHHSLRIPRMGRDIGYDCWSCDLLCAASSPELYRINLEQGRFLASLISQSPALNVVRRSKMHGLVACGGEDGAVECFDMRARASVGRIDSSLPSGNIDQEVTALDFDEDGGFLMAVGSSKGKVLIYDLRSQHPLKVKDHMLDNPILDIKWHHTLNSERKKLITTDNQIVRIWDPETGDGMVSIEPSTGRINDVCVFGGSGLLLLALDCSQIPAYFLPALGPAPSWCSSLENLTEETEEGSHTTIYDNYKFVTKEDLQKLNLTTLIGTNLLRAYMHGFFIDYRLYKKAKDLIEPFAYEEYVERRKQDKLEEELRNRITIKRRIPKVNRKLHESIIQHDELEGETREEDGNDPGKTSKKKKRKGLDTGILEDDRFKALFSDKDFEIDERSSEYLALHPVASKKQPSLMEEHFAPVMDDEDSDANPSSQSEDENDLEKRRPPRLHEVKDERHAEAYWNNLSLAKEDSLSLAERIAALGNDSLRQVDNVRFGPGGSREISFVSRSSATYKEDEDEDETDPRKKRRGIQPLGLKPTRSGSRGRGRAFRGRGKRGRR